MTRPRRPVTGWWATPAAALWLGAGALGQVTTPAIPAPRPAEVEPTPPLDEALYDRLVSELESDDLTTRELATSRLSTLPGLEFARVESKLVHADIGPETRRRLELVALELYRDQPKGGLGVTFSRVSPVRGVLIEGTIKDKNFPASMILQAGDLITAAGGQRLRSSDHLRWIILSHDPGELLRTTVERGGETIELDLPLGDYNALENASPLDPVSIQRSLADRLTREQGDAASAEIGSGLGVEQWTQAAGEVDRLASAFTGVQNATVGGVPRAEPVGRLAGAPIEAVGAIEVRRVVNYEIMSPQQRAAEYQRLSAERDRLGTRVGVYRTLLSDPDLDAKERAALVANLRDLSRQVQQAEAEIQRLIDSGELDATEP